MGHRPFEVFSQTESVTARMSGCKIPKLAVKERKLLGQKFYPIWILALIMVVVRHREAYVKNYLRVPSNIKNFENSSTHRKVLKILAQATLSFISISTADLQFLY